jgi:hypothetical protein
LTLGLLLAACGGSGGAAGKPSAVDDLQRDFAKVLTTRDTALDDLQIVSAAVTAVQRADDATKPGAVTDPDLVTTSASRAAQAAPIVARTRSDVASYQNALERDARDTKVPLDDAARAKIAALCTTGRAEAEAIKATASAYATEWPAYSGLAQALVTWMQRSQRGEYASIDLAHDAYKALTTPFAADLAIGQASAAAAERTRTATTTEMVTGIAGARTAVTELRDVPLPSTFQSLAPSSSVTSSTASPTTVSP